MGYVARTGERRGYKGVWRGNLRERDHLGDPCVDGRIICIKMDLKDVGCGGYGLERSSSRQGQVAGTFEYGNESSGSIKWGEFLN